MVEGDMGWFSSKIMQLCGPMLQDSKIGSSVATKKDKREQAIRTLQMAANDKWYTHEGEDGTTWYVKDGCDNDGTDEFTRDQPSNWIEV